MNVQHTLPFSNEAAGELCERGFCTVPFPHTGTILRLRNSFKQFVESLPEAEHTAWEMAVEEPGKFDDGLIYRNGEGDQDLKYFFHWKPRLQGLLVRRGILLSDQQVTFLQECEQLYMHCAQQLRALGEAVNHVGVFPFDVRHAVEEALARPHGVWHTTLRLLYYPTQSAGARAGEHVDKSFVTMHMGDEGGKLYMRESPDAAKVTYISPGPDEALFFFGKSAEEKSGGNVRALHHGSMAEDGVERHAMVFFGHAVPTR